MATAPMDPAMGQDPGMTPPEGGELGGQAAPAGFTICIKVGGDGAITVSSEPAQEEMAEGEAMGTPAKDIQEAVAVAIDIFKAGGQMPDPAAAEQSMAAGFNKVKQVGM